MSSYTFWRDVRTASQPRQNKDYKPNAGAPDDMTIHKSVRANNSGMCQRVMQFAGFIALEISQKDCFNKK
jgi:hypothetical protein